METIVTKRDIAQIGKHVKAHRNLTSIQEVIMDLENNNSGYKGQQVNRGMLK